MRRANHLPSMAGPSCADSLPGNSYATSLLRLFHCQTPTPANPAPSNIKDAGSGTLVPAQDGLELGPLDVPSETNPEHPLVNPPTWTTNSAPLALAGILVTIPLKVKLNGPRP